MLSSKLINIFKDNALSVIVPVYLILRNVTLDVTYFTSSFALVVCTIIFPVSVSAGKNLFSGVSFHTPHIHCGLYLILGTDYIKYFQGIEFVAV